ncbi:MAG: 50S ribosomal protein L9 [Planctomycetaceae bacterium]|nr:MAG: 50S ribosomal protein L9 [Planctomycetaceae bacterium]
MPISTKPSSRRSVQLLLAEDIPTLGKQGDIVQVRSGYARNYLLPQGLATVASDHNKMMVEKHRERLAEIAKKKLQELRKMAEAVGKYSVTIEAHANEEGHLYGSIGAPEISKQLKNAGFEVNPEHVRLDGPLKELAMYTVKIRLHEEVETECKVWVVPTAAK